MCVPRSWRRAGAPWLLMLQLLLPSPGAPELYCSLPSPRNVHFESKNLKNLLHWSPPEGLGEGVLYNVKYLIYGIGKWIKKSECKNISRTWCDLSSETHNHEDQYYAKVKVFSGGNCSNWTETARFNPLTDTKIDPPMVTVSSTERSISIVLTAPEKWKRTLEERSVSLHQVYSGLQYNVSVFNKKTKKRWVFSIKNNTLVVPRLESNIVYCVSVQTYVTTPLLLSEFSEEHCIATLKDPTVEQTVTIVFGYILPIILTAFIVSMAGYCVHRYIHVSKQKHPPNLVLQYTNKFDETVFMPSEKIVVNFITLNIVDEYKTSQETTNLIHRTSHNCSSIHDESSVDEPLTRALEVNCLADTSEDVKILPDSVRYRNCSPRCQHGFRYALGQKNEGAVEYALDVRPAELFPVQKVQECGSTEKSSEPRELLDEPQITLRDLADSKIGQSYCPQLDVQVTDVCLVQELKELNWMEKAATPEVLLGEPQSDLVNVDTEKIEQSYHPQLRTITQSPQEQTGTMGVEEEDEQTILVDWDPHTGKLFIPTLSSFEHDTHEEVLEHEACDQPADEGLLSKLYERQVSVEPSEDQEPYLLQFKEQWGLHVKMED
ncbi:interleukin-20 receptor subunit alpha isoform X2 [Pelodiscus sinensis]|uniref:Interleukin 20 receptor subunit alpha n=1 Tax=Pelodiscus sinensis TaxID=13735 RepID=K7GCV4_PELSI|nr:interleukin-20 receptor subunit alpha isoform X2 [Pelodiscus sinensis]|eukprot:XP_006112787.1 interleukin-20 receptor subunit alpha isoform X2 [Pelodiscus sinensis]